MNFKSVLAFVFFASGFCSVQGWTCPGMLNFFDLVNGCLDIAVNDNLTATACRIESTLLIKPLAIVNLSDFSITYNYLTDKYYAVFKMIVRSPDVLDIVRKTAEYSHKTDISAVQFMKITHVKFLSKSNDFFKLRDDINFNNDRIAVNDQDYVELKFSCATQDIANNIYKEAISPKRKPGQIIEDILDVELESFERHSAKTFREKISCVKVVAKPKEKKTTAGVIDVFDGSKKTYDIERIHRIVVEDEKKNLAMKELNRIAEKEWFLIHRREDKELNFNRTWKEYQTGFGDVGSNFWLGFDNLFMLIRTLPVQTKTQLRMEFETKKGEQKVAVYKTFKITQIQPAHTLTLSDFDSANSTVDKNPLTECSDVLFSTADLGNDMSSAAKYGGGWWYGDSCDKVNFNSKCMFWIDESECLKRARMYLIIK